MRAFPPYASRGCSALGELRDPTPFVETLFDPAVRSAHVAAASALGILDDERSRDALADYIVRSIGTETGRASPEATVPGAHAAVLGLAPLPYGAVATALRDQERAARELARTHGADELLRTTAARVLTAWDEAWGRKQLLHL